jgi:hypothetical protein
MGPAATAVLIVTAITTTYQAKKQEEAAEAQQESDEKRALLEKKRAALKTSRARASAVRRARAAKAAQLAQAQVGEGTGGSGLAGAQAGVQNQLNEGLQFMNANQDISNRISSLNLQASKKQAGFQKDINRAGAVQNIAQSAGSVFGNS